MEQGTSRGCAKKVARMTAKTAPHSMRFKTEGFGSHPVKITEVYIFPRKPLFLLELAGIP